MANTQRCIVCALETLFLSNIIISLSGVEEINLYVSSQFWYLGTFVFHYFPK